MVIRKIYWKNIMSYGNSIQELDFSDESSLWRLSGSVGAGKSTIMSLPKLLFYGKIRGIREADLANRINHNGWIKGEIGVGQDEYIIERGFLPSSLTIIKNGNRIEKNSLPEMQAVINTEILEGMPYQIFSNILTPSLNNYRLSFVSLTPADKRTVIDKLFSLEIINDIGTLIKNDIKSIGNNINNLNAQIVSLNQTIQKSEFEIKNLTAINEEENAKKIAKLKEKISDVDASLEVNNNNFKIYNDTLYTANAKHSKLLNEKITLSNELSNINRKMDLFKQDKCPTCGGNLQGEEYSSIKAELEESYNKVKKEYEDKIKEFDESASYLKKANEGIDIIRKNISTLTVNKNSFKTQIEEIQRSGSLKNEGKSIQNIINDSKQNIVKLRKEIEESNEVMANLDILQNLYGDDGIKKKIMNNYIPALNEELKKTLEQFSFPYTLEFDNNFNPILRSLGEEISVDNLSTGEHKELDIAVLCSFLKILKIKYPQMNLVCFDETISSLDPVSSKEIIKYLKALSCQMKLNIIIVSHDNMEDSLFDKRLFISKEMGFSKITYDE